MPTRTKLTSIAARIFAPSLNQTLAARSTPQQLVPYHPSQTTPTPFIIDLPATAVSRSLLPQRQSQRQPQRQPDTTTLSHFLRIGRTYHPLCRHAFVEKHVIGYYHYERRIEFRTCAVAAAYAGAFGPQSIERPDFSYSMALWRLSQKVGYDLNQRGVVGPTGRHQSVAEEMMQLVDHNLWNREGLVEWLDSLRL